MKISMLVMLFATALVLTACSKDHNDGIKVPESLSQALKDKYPAATSIEWEQKAGYFVADCRVDGKEMNVWFNATGEWQLTEMDILWENLPEAVQTTFATDPTYKGWKRDDFDLLEYPLQPMEYIIEVENGKTELQLFYSVDGQLMLTKDVTDKDDTHYPKK